MSPTPILTSPLCEECALEGRVTLASYRFQAEEESLQGPQLGDPDCWPGTPACTALCEEHYRRLTPDACLDYVPLNEALDLTL